MIKNASNIKLNKTVGVGLPQMGEVLVEWFQSMSFFVVVKTQVGYQTQETMKEVKFMGDWQPLSAREISYKPTDQRAWKWFRCHALPTLVLNEDDVVIKDGVQYRVKGLWPWDEYGYREYQLIEDYSGRGPDIEVTTP